MQSEEQFANSLNTSFKTTRWSLILRGSAQNPMDAAEAIRHLCETYWYPLYAYVRRRGYCADRACDITQGFFSQFLSGKNIQQVHPDKGRLRAFLLASIKNYLKNEWREKSTLRRGGKVKLISIDEEPFERRFQNRLSISSDVERQFEKDWAEALLEKVLRDLRSDYETAGRLNLYLVLHPFLTVSKERLPLADLAVILGISLSGVKMSVLRIRKQYADRVRQEIMATVDSPGEVDEEIGRMITALSS